MDNKNQGNMFTYRSTAKVWLVRNPEGEGGVDKYRFVLECMSNTLTTRFERVYRNNIKCFK